MGPLTEPTVILIVVAGAAAVAVAALGAAATVVDRHVRMTELRLEVLRLRRNRRRRIAP
ncbi:MAG: hypothetical protein JNM94_16640 [Phycisphaerae bacterium]|nr:hypothetical protein [Phycisphaerae bacterium]